VPSRGAANLVIIVDNDVVI